jgi:ribonuclease HII
MFFFDSPLGVDEVGRGPWAGPVVAVASCYSHGFAELPVFARLRDSKALSESARERIVAELAPYRGTLFEYGLGLASPEEIDRINIRMATREAMDRALADLLARASPVDRIFPVLCRIDGRDKFKFPDRMIAPEYVVK